uniref:Papilin n=1 Tax=Magallana gigas TaxID=29159 RepID=K1PKN2_MAGGI
MVNLNLLLRTRSGRKQRCDNNAQQEIEYQSCNTRKAGCDNVLGSPAQRDVCGVCQGGGQSCKLIQGAFTIPQLYSVIKSNEETFVLNGQQRDDKPVLIDIGGTTLLYTLEGSGRNLVKKLRGQGPIKNSIQIYMMAKEEVNPGVTYEFYIPRTGREALYIPTELLVNPIQTLEQRQAELRSGDIGESSYFWNYGGWTPCSAICGNVKISLQKFTPGFRKRLVLCMNRLTGKRAELENCVASDRPADSEQCKGEDCDSTSEDSTVEWELGDWGPCSSSCDIGDQLQDVTCVSTDPSGRTVTVDDQKCIQLYGRKPEYRRSCNENIPCPYWTPVEEWSSCNKDCGMGEQSRAVLCVSIDNRRLADSACDSSKKPASTRPCMVRQCDSNPEDPGVNCRNSPFGCCQDGRTAAQGSNFEGCPQECTSSRYGCCPDQKTPVRGPDGKGCPPECLQSRYGCCQDQKTPARGPNEEGCPSDCSRTRFGCCSDNRTPARGPNGEGCTVHCSRYRYGCCPDNVTIARGSNGEGCPVSCSGSTYGCCPDGRTVKRGPDNEGCSLECSRYRYGCCPDNLTPARGPNGEGCPNVCTTSRYGCCEDGRTEARGLNGEGCPADCSRRRYGCCPDNVTPARGPDGEGCPNACATSLYGCCPDRKTAARGPDREGCPADCNRYRYGCCADNITPARGENGEGCPSNCTMSQYGCCPDRLTEAKGFNFEGCSNQCLRSRYGCCPDGITEARGPNNDGCFYVDCSRYQFGCCSDNITIARGPDGEGCPSNCTLSVYGCCADQVTEAQGYNMEGCPSECLRSRYGCCPDGIREARGPNAEGCAVSCVDMQFGCCPDNQTPARGPNSQGCFIDCSRYQYGCCSDELTPARGPRGEGCPSNCTLSQYGCCPDQVTEAKGYNNEGCFRDCRTSRYGCCQDGRTEARGPNGEGCVLDCTRQRFGCCPDSNTPARGPDGEGCPSDCTKSLYGCCYDGTTSASGPDGIGCPPDCLRYRYGCFRVISIHMDVVKMVKLQLMGLDKKDVCQEVHSQKKSTPSPHGSTMEPTTVQSASETMNSTTAEVKTLSPNGIRIIRTKLDEEDLELQNANDQGVQGYRAGYLWKSWTHRLWKTRVTNGNVEFTHVIYSCGLKPERGPCTNYSVLYFYNSTAKRCQRFWYGGCDGNDNRFNTEDECKEKCSGSRTENTDRRPVTDKQTCQNSYYGCCPDGVTFARGSNYEGCTQSEDRPVCQQPSDSGRDCEGAKLEIRWYYKTDIQRCDRFWYRGCGGNNNNFKTEEECRQTCTGGGGRPEDPCQLPPQVGRCRARLQRWYYNAQTKECQLFTYGGCGGNANNFRDRKECFTRCMPKDMIRNLQVHHATSNAIMVTWEPPQNNDVESYKVAYLGTKYYRDTVKQDPMKEVVLTSGMRSYTISNLLEGADYMINVYPQFNGRGVGPKSSIMGKTKTWLLCDDSLYGCCPDGITAASGQNYAGCADEDPCKKSTWGCCEDGISEATGPNFEGCDLDGRPSGDFCNETVYGCCPDGETPAQGANYDGCPREPEITPVGICQKKEERGPCSDFEVKWFYNTTSQRCDRFWYGGCEGNDNRFDDEEACSRRCKQTTPDTGSKPVCEQPKVTGPCRAYFKKYYFNGRECEEFIYGGCQGNENNFETIEQCEETCEIDIDNTRGQETCQQPMDTGPCRGNIPRWYFDRQSNQCLEFLYGGCQGNTNNFETREECQKSCASGTGQPDRQDQDVCKLNSDTGPCRALVMRWYYDYNDGVCRNFSYGGCDGNQNNFETQQACESTCSRDHVCKPFITGQIQCLAYQRRYKYDATSGDCMQFIYGGCGGNSNNFGSVEACRRKCAPERLRPAVTTESPIEGSGDGGEGYCHLQVDQGSCKALIPAWYYDHLTGQCSEFQYGGCGGNENRFTSQEVCESSCSRENVCNMEKEEGNCLAYFQRYFYNKKTQSCEGFIYGGCGGNANNFDSLDACNRKCIQRECSNQDFRCRSGQCVDVRRRCDGVPDCTDMSDEDSTMCAPVTTCPEGYFRCADRSCVDGRRCDGRQDCADNSDEYQCVVNTTCPQGYFRCADRSCVAGRRCDGRQDCADNSDEYQCAVQNPPTDVDVTPSRDDNYQVILRWRAPASSGLNPVLDYKILYTNRGPNADESQWYTQQAEGNQEYMYVSGLQPDSTYYFKIQARNAGGYGPFSRAVVYIAPSRVTDAPRGKDPNCMLPVDRGSCNNMTIMYHYDPSISDCRPFRWYGCTGNANRFSSGQECRSRCWDRYNVIPTRGPVYPTERPRVTSRPTYPTERPPVTTRRPIYPTEGPRVTTTREYTVNVDLCDEKDERGPCSNYSVKWYYNKTEQKCRRFWYGGCEGNANRFDDEQECLDVCINRVRPNPGTPATTKAPDDKDNEIDDKTCGSRFGCCPDGITPARDFYLSNCNDETGPDIEVIQGDYTSLIKEPDTDVVIQCNRYQTGYGSISWYKDGFQLAQTGRVFIQSDGSLLIRMATVDDSGMYACRIASVGSTPEIERFRLQVEVPITIFPTPAKIVVQPGMNAFLHCQAYGNPRPRVAWSRDGYDVSRDPRFSVYPNGTLIIQRTLEQDMGSYLCVANNGVSNPAQRIVMLQLRESLRASIEQVEERKREGETLYLTCSGFGYPTPSITWEKNGLPLTSDQRIKIQGGSLRVINLALEDTGTYTCIVMNDEEKVEDTVSIQVTPFDLLPSTCVDSASKVKCSLIVAARLCGHTRYSRPCCESCQREKTRIMQQSSTILG